MTIRRLLPSSDNDLPILRNEKSPTHHDEPGLLVGLQMPCIGILKFRGVVLSTGLIDQLLHAGVLIGSTLILRSSGRISMNVLEV